ncbi:MAG: TIGR03943 family protein [Verrucomicrobiota bacterium]|nr:TIGR03943 family protein [Verrucomicrobiota bacterium]
MTKLFSRWLPCVTLAAWSGILLYFYFSGRLQAFLVPMFRPYVVIAGLAMAVMAVIFLIFPADAACCSTAECSHPLSRGLSGKLLTFLILLLPITVSAMFSPDAFGKAAIENRGIITDAAALGLGGRGTARPPDLPLPTKDEAPAKNDGETPPAPQPAPAAGAASQPPQPAINDYLQRTPEGYIVAEVLDLLYAAQDNQLRKDFEGKTVELIGQLMPETSNNSNGNRFKAVRMFMTCCAADARPVATVVEAEKLPDFPEMTWVKIVGTSTFPLENGRRVAVLKANKVEKSAPPEETMLY